MVCPANSRNEATQIVSRLRSDHPDATHVCWALMAGGESAAVDDGEPSGTAGRPMLEVLRHQDLEGVLATVVRYYGGVKLGAGGLVRAYTDAIVQALARTKPVERIQWTQVQCQIPYAFEGTVRRILATHRANLISAEHGSLVTLGIEVPNSDIEAFQQSIIDACQGNATWLD